MKFGRKPARYTTASVNRMMRLGRTLTDLGAPPAASDDFVAAVEKPTGGNWGMLGNDNYGDCVFADTGHQMMIRTANTTGLVIPTDAQVLSLYSAVTGFVANDPSTDQGADELTVIQYLASTGWLGWKDDASGNIDIEQPDHIRWGVQLCGAVRLGITVTQGMMDQFNAGQPWDGSGDQTPLGGHDVPIVKYDADTTMWVVSWGKRIPMTPAGFTACVEEAHLEYSDTWLEKTGLAPNGLNRDQLLADLQVDSSQ